MGQYYMPIIIGEDGVVKSVYSRDYGSGMKLMEHSYLGNDFVNAVSSLIWNTPAKVAWIGDYSDDYDGSTYESKMPEEKFKDWYNVAWGDQEAETRVHPSTDEHDMDTPGLYLVNHTLGVYIDLDEFKLLNRWQEKGDWKNEAYDETMTSTWCINPMPLLTACGNGRGCGDYYDCYPDFGKIGSWAFDTLEITDEKPSMEPVMFTFTEQRKAG